MNDVLTLWERAAAAPPDVRDEALLGAAAPASLSARNAALLALRARLFGATQRLVAACPGCAAQLEFEIDCGALARSLLPAPDAAGAHELRHGGYRIVYRVPESGDLRAAANADDFATALLRRCVAQCELGGIAHAVDTLPDEVTDALSDALDALEPGTCVDFDLRCVDCGVQWNAPMDCAAVLYGEVRARAEALLVEVDALARAYGWSEAQVLALSPTRRAAYLQLVGAA
ncbi:hypothetical protein [Caballeronia sp. J97]|uniref:hypothetical protein n=1 Tax=Caballeronia sp. J97 TaxID=2805429 RepID=UPI002AAF34F5|nr:hypothetical protein [Caballeronia sp. J97]